MINDPRMAIFSRTRQNADAVKQSVEKKDETEAASKNTAQDDVQITPQASENVKQPTFTGPGAKLIKITEKLTTLIKQETGHLVNHQTKDAATLHGEKTRLMAEYKNTLNHLQVNEHLLGPKQSPIRDFIRKVTDQFRDALKEHTRVVLRMKSISEGIIKSIGEEVSKNTRPVVRYGANAAFKGPEVAQATSLSLNQVI